jgi:hypothetical protein
MSEFQAVEKCHTRSAISSITGQRRRVCHVCPIAGRHCCGDDCSAGGCTIAGRCAVSGPLDIADAGIYGV